MYTPAYAPPHAPTPTPSHPAPQQQPHHIQLLQTNTYLKQALEIELANNENSKYQLSVRETAFLKLSKPNEYKINDTFNEHNKLTTNNLDKSVHKHNAADHNDNMHLFLKSYIVGNAISQSISQKTFHNARV